MRNHWSVTYERYYPSDDVEVCEPDEYGFVIRDASLRDAMAAFSTSGIARWASATEADEAPIMSPRWFSCYKWNDGTREYYRDGVVENRYLHIPPHVTASSRRRIARLLGLDC